MQPEELTELLDEDLEMWAQGGTRILPKSELQRQKPDSLPPVAYPSVPPPSMAPASTTSSAPVWAAMIGMAAVFFLAAAGGGIFYAIHRSANPSATESVASQSVTVTATSEPEHVTVAPTTELVTISAPTATQKVTSTAVATPAPVVRYGTIQTFAAGAGKPVFLDGKQIGTGGSHIKAACGKHAVSVGAGKAKTYDIPCNATPMTVGTPDGV